MANPTSKSNDFFLRLRDMERRLNLRIDRRAAFDGTQLTRTVQKLEELIAGLLSQVNGIFSGYVQAGGNITAGGTGSFAAGLTSTGAAALDLSTIPGTRQITYQHVASGRFGFAPSRVESKIDLSEVLPFTAADVYQAIPYVWHYVNQVAIRDDPENEYFDPTYEVPLEIGLVANYLIENNLSAFVVFNEDGSPKTVDLALFGAVANLVAVRDLDRRLTAAGL